MKTKKAAALLTLLFALVVLVPSITAELDAETKTNQVDDEKNGRCNYCCGGWSYGRCRRWCCSPDEADVLDTEATTENSDAAFEQLDGQGGHGGGKGGGGKGGGGGGPGGDKGGGVPGGGKGGGGAGGGKGSGGPGGGKGGGRGGQGGGGGGQGGGKGGGGKGSGGEGGGRGGGGGGGSM